MSALFKPLMGLLAASFSESFPLVVSTLYAFSEHELAHKVCLVAMELARNNKVWQDASRWFSRNWLEPMRTEEEIFLTSIPFVNVFAAQMVLYGARMTCRDFCSADEKTHMERCPWLPGLMLVRTSNTPRVQTHFLLMHAPTTFARKWRPFFRMPPTSLRRSHRSCCSKRKALNTRRKPATRPTTRPRYPVTAPPRLLRTRCQKPLIRTSVAATRANSTTVT
jgi:hypothetical protein